MEGHFILSSSFEHVKDHKTNARPFLFLFFPHPPDFWGPVSNFGIPIAAVADTQKSPDLYVMMV